VVQAERSPEEDAYFDWKWMDYIVRYGGIIARVGAPFDVEMWSLYIIGRAVLVTLSLDRSDITYDVDKRAVQKNAQRPVVGAKQ
jgi:hypothetical protein